MFAGRASPESGIVVHPSDSEFTAKELEDLTVELERPELKAVIPENELRSLKKEEKKRQEVINGKIIFIYLLTFALL